MIYIHITRSFIFIHYQCYITYLQFLGQPIMHQPITSSMELSLQSLGRTHIPSLEYSKNVPCYTVDIVLAYIVSFLSIIRLKNSFYGIKICTYCIPLLKVNKKYCWYPCVHVLGLKYFAIIRNLFARKLQGHLAIHTCCSWLDENMYVLKT